jgi:hypothetical protein
VDNSTLDLAKDNLVIKASLLKTSGTDDTGAAVRVGGRSPLFHEKHLYPLPGSRSGRHRPYRAAAYHAAVIRAKGFHPLNYMIIPLPVGIPFCSETNLILAPSILA